MYMYTRNTCIAEPREALGGGGAHKGVGGQESNEVNHVTGEGVCTFFGS